MSSMKHDLTDITFVIPYMCDSNERSLNLAGISYFLRKNFDTNIVLVQVGPISTEHMLATKYLFIKQDIDALFYRTRVINAGIRLVETDYFSIYDTDTIFPIENIITAALLLREGVQAVYPYDGRFIDIDRGYLKDGIIKEATSFTTESKGGAVFLNTEDYFRAGLENENIIGWGPEDAERYARMQTLGYSIRRVPGKCWHINHPRGVNSSPSNPNTATNNAEYEKVKAMNKEELQDYIKTWDWVKPRP